MSQLDSELNMLRIRLAALEEQKRIELETASEKKEFPLKTLEEIINAKKIQIEDDTKHPRKRVPLAKYYEKEHVAFLEPILDALKNIQERLDALEKRELFNLSADLKCPSV